MVYIFLYVVTGFIIASLYWWSPNKQNEFPILRGIIIFCASLLLFKYFFYMMVSPWYDVVERYKTKKRAREARELGLPEYNPKVSVILPAWNEEVGLLGTVKSILASEYRNLEIVVVNDGSTDSSDALMREFLEEYNTHPQDISITYEYKENGGKGRALNHGIKLASGELIVSIDADCALTPTTIGNFVQQFEDKEVMAAVGNVKIGNSSHVLGTLQYLEFLFSFYFKKADSLLNTIYIIGGAAGAFRREVFDKIGFYNHNNITEDIELSVRIQKAGMKIVYAGNAVVYTEGATTLKGLSAQRLRWKQGRMQTFLENKKLFFSRAEKHNKVLTWGVLPFAIFGDVQLFFEVIFLIFLYIYSYLTHDFSSFISGMIVVSSMFMVQMFDDPKSRKKLSLYILAPVGWLLFYITTYIEYVALLQSIERTIHKKKLTWQKWDRNGCIEEGSTIKKQ